jgi:hypothetical protein
MDIGRDRTSQTWVEEVDVVMADLNRDRFPQMPPDRSNVT